MKTNKLVLSGALLAVAALTLTTATRMVHAEVTTSSVGQLADHYATAPAAIASYWMMPATTNDDTQAHLIFIGGKTSSLVFVAAAGASTGIFTGAAVRSLIAPALD